MTMVGPDGLGSVPGVLDKGR